ncbi:hypothetical protein I203_101140 [Kwoniella mangroviensis CBS 8507]|uniref:uncharacterized protein n=1 Tax=Kwoniella mangroviensis CBS 8507 TaxID=1296122 RepID=UPI00080CCAB8|nr:uncharacterized protein I203_02774 [Kwoniella mangroviensis CBS 8507]OCF68114.1 hypothetical protein I203_02774 [Kwoniella mangroviensis CBS 8507]
MAYLALISLQWILKFKPPVYISQGLFLSIYTALESVSWIHSYFTSIPNITKNRLEISNEDRRGLFEELMNNLRGKDNKGFDDWLRGWFYIPRLQSPNKETSSITNIFNASQIFDVPEEESELVMRYQEIKRGNVEELLCGIFFDSALFEVLSDPIKNHTLISMMNRLELQRNHKFPSGHNNALKPLCPRLDESLVKSEYRPLMFYMGMAIIHWIFELLIFCAGFKKVRQGCMTGWYHPNERKSGIIKSLIRRSATKGNEGKQRLPQPQPIVFIPGLAGPFFLIRLILNLLVLDQPILVVDQPHLLSKLRLSMPSTWTDQITIPSLPEISKDTISFLQKQTNYDRRPKATEDGKEAAVGMMIIAHSLGSALASSLIKHINDNTNVASSTITDTNENGDIKLVLLDPISILLSHSHLTQTIYLSSPKREEQEGNMGMLKRYLIREKGMMRYLINEFNPFDSFFPIHSYLESPKTSSNDNTKMKMQMKVKMKVILSEKDHLLPVNEIGSYLSRNQVDHEVLQGVQHGLWVMDRKGYDRVWDCIENMIKSNIEKDDNNNNVRCKVETNTSVQDIMLEDKSKFTMAMSRTRSKSLLLISEILNSPSLHSSPLKMNMSRMRSRTISSMGYCQDSEQQSMSRQCSSIGMNKTLNLSRFKRGYK